MIDINLSESPEELQQNIYKLKNFITYEEMDEYLELKAKGAI